MKLSVRYVKSVMLMIIGFLSAMQSFSQWGSVYDRPYSDLIRCNPFNGAGTENPDYSLVSMESASLPYLPLLTATSQIRKPVLPDDVILEYKIVDSSLYISAFATDSICYTTQTLDWGFWSSLKKFRKKLKSADQREFLTLGKILYYHLFKPIERFVTGKRRLIIIPDHSFSDIPFETLVRIDDTPRQASVSIPYLIGEFEIIYRYAQDESLKESDAKDSVHVRSSSGYFEFTGFSPVFQNQHGINALPASRVEITAIAALFQRQGLSSCEATDDNSRKCYFKYMAANSRIIHLATHFLESDPDSLMPGYIFWGYDPTKSCSANREWILTLDEIADLHLNADLVVLNACSSGIERRSARFGLQMPARLFLKAGARNTMSTLWDINDEMAGNFMIEFYQLCLSGKTYSEALRAVKLHMISSPGTTLPTVWAPYVLTCR